MCVVLKFNRFPVSNNSFIDYFMQCEWNSNEISESEPVPTEIKFIIKSLLSLTSLFSRIYKTVGESISINILNK